MAARCALISAVMTGALGFGFALLKLVAVRFSRHRSRAVLRRAFELMQSARKAVK